MIVAIENQSEESISVTFPTGQINMLPKEKIAYRLKEYEQIYFGNGAIYFTDHGEHVLAVYKSNTEHTIESL